MSTPIRRTLPLLATLLKVCASLFCHTGQGSFHRLLVQLCSSDSYLQAAAGQVKLVGLQTCASNSASLHLLSGNLQSASTDQIRFDLKSRQLTFTGCKGLQVGLSQCKDRSMAPHLYAHWCVLCQQDDADSKDHHQPLSESFQASVIRFNVPGPHVD